MTNQTTTKGTKPTHRIYLVIGEGKPATWTRIGAAWPNKDGKGFSISCDALPLQGRIVMREVQDEEQAEGGH